MTPSSPSNLPQDARSLIRLHEGCRLDPYWDSLGYPTQGWGRQMSLRQHVPLSLFPAISQQQADVWFDQDFQVAIRACQHIFGVYFPSMGSARNAALVDMAFELGEQGLNGFHDLIQATFAGRWQQAADAAKASLWDRQVPERAEDDEALLRTGDWGSLAITIPNRRA